MSNKIRAIVVDVETGEELYNIYDGEYPFCNPDDKTFLHFDIELRNSIGFLLMLIIIELSIWIFSFINLLF